MSRLLNMSVGIPIIKSFALIFALVFLFNSQVSAGYITRSYISDQKINPGMLVSLDGKNKNKIVPATNENSEHLIGVAVAPTDSTIELGPDNGNVTVTTVGTISVYVSDVNGPVKAGDSIATSPLAGVGMKGLTATNVIGSANADFTPDKNSQKVELKLKDGTKKQVSVGKIPVLIKVGSYNPPSKPTNPLQQFVSTVTGRDVSPARLIMGTLFLAIVFVIIVVTIFTAVRTGITSLGRNPMARKKVYLGLAQVFLIVVIVAIVSAVVAYGILVW